jgi:cysteine desulfurase
VSVYLDCNATTQVEPAVADEVIRHMLEEFGNAGSRTHEYGVRAKRAVDKGRAQVAKVVKAEPDEVVFTSGATESNNLAILGLERYGEETGRRHIISTSIEHKAVLEPLEVLAGKGFEVTLISPSTSGRVEPEAIISALRADTLLVSLMHVNNETGVIQPVTEVSNALEGHLAFFHVDAAQGFGKDLETLQHSRIDLISVSSHKLHGPKGVGALLVKRRGGKRIPLQPLMYGGGQERGLRPGTLPVPLIAGLGLAAELAAKHAVKRAAACLTYRDNVLRALTQLNPIINGDLNHTLPHVLNLSFADVDSEAIMVALKNVVSISNGSACTSQSYKPSHVLKAMGLHDQVIKGAVRLSWSYMTEGPDWDEVAEIINRLR